MARFSGRWSMETTGNFTRHASSQSKDLSTVHQLGGEVALYALELVLLSGVAGGARVRVGLLLPLGAMEPQHPQHHAHSVSLSFTEPNASPSTKASLPDLKKQSSG